MRFCNHIQFFFKKRPYFPHCLCLNIKSSEIKNTVDVFYRNNVSEVSVSQRLSNRTDHNRDDVYCNSHRRTVANFTEIPEIRNKQEKINYWSHTRTTAKNKQKFDIAAERAGYSPFENWPVLISFITL